MATTIYVVTGQTPSTTINVVDPTSQPGQQAAVTGWLLSEAPTRPIRRPARLENIVEPINFSTGVHHRWLDEDPRPRRRRIASLDETVEPINFSTGVHHRWLDEVTRPLPRRHTVSLDETAWVPLPATVAPSPYGWFPSDQRVVRPRAVSFNETSWVPLPASTAAPSPYGWFPSDQQVAPRKYPRRLDEITVPLGQALPSIPVAPAWFMQSEQPQAPKARYIANVGPCHWTVVFAVLPPPSLPAVPTDFVSGQRMIGWY